jgi:hypothetical protein
MLCALRDERTGLSFVRVDLEVKVKVTLQPIVSQSVSQSVSLSWCRGPSGARDQLLVNVRQLQFCQCESPSLLRGVTVSSNMSVVSMYIIFAVYMLLCGIKMHMYIQYIHSVSRFC